MKLHVVSQVDPNEGTILACNKGEVIFIGNGGPDWECGKCGAVLSRNMDGPAPIRNAVLQCPGCDSHNALPL
jgi:ribosomal protein S27AE